MVAALACVVHYDFLGLITSSNLRRTVDSIDKVYQHRCDGGPVLEFKNIWIPKPGTDINLGNPDIFKPVVLVDDYDDNGFWSDDSGDEDDFWHVTTDDEDAVDDDGGGTPAADIKDGGTPAADIKDDGTPRRSAVDRQTVDDNTENRRLSDDYDDSDYVAPGQEMDDDVF